MPNGFRSDYDATENRMTATHTYDKRGARAWALYDWAQSAFSTTVVAGFFPVFFKEYWSAGVDAGTSTLQLGIAHSASSLALALIAPMLGTLADKMHGKKRFLFAFTAAAVMLTAVLFFIPKGAWFAAALVFALASLAYAATNIFYDALLVNVADDAHAHRVSSQGYAWGYLGGGVLFALNVAMVLKPQWFGLGDSTQAVRVSFLSVALWWALFALPLFVRVREPRATGAPPFGACMRASVVELVHTARAIRRIKPVLWFLAAYWLYIDAVGTVIRMAVDYGLALGFGAAQLLSALLMTQFVAFPAALLFGRIAERFGAKAGIFIGIGVYIAISLWAMAITAPWEFYGIATGIGLVQGGVQALSRSLYARLIPVEKAGEFFGFYNMLGKFAAIVGPVFMGAIAAATGNPRWSMLALLILFVAGAALLTRVREPPARASA